MTLEKIVFIALGVLQLVVPMSIFLPIVPRPAIVAIETVSTSPSDAFVGPRRFERMGDHPMDMFLSAISIVESSGCKNTKHRLITYGLHKGTSAIGCYGIMPITAKDVVRWSGNAFLKRLDGLSHIEIASILSKDKSLAHEVAREYASKLHRRFKGNYEKMAYAWLYGPEKVKVAFDNAHNYVQKVAYHYQNALVKYSSSM